MATLGNVLAVVLIAAGAFLAISELAASASLRSKLERLAKRRRDSTSVWQGKTQLRRLLRQHADDRNAEKEARSWKSVKALLARQRVTRHPDNE